jgi:hypothetical protein
MTSGANTVARRGSAYNGSSKTWHAQFKSLWHTAWQFFLGLLKGNRALSCQIDLFSPTCKCRSKEYSVLHEICFNSLKGARWCKRCEPRKTNDQAWNIREIPLGSIRLLLFDVCFKLKRGRSMFDTWKRLRGVSLVNPIEQRPQADSEWLGPGNTGQHSLQRLSARYICLVCLVCLVCRVALTFDFHMTRDPKRDPRCQRSEGAAMEASSFSIIKSIMYTLNPHCMCIIVCIYIYVYIIFMIIYVCIHV